MNEITKEQSEKLTDIVIANLCAELSKRNWSLKMLSEKADLPYESVKKLVNGKIRKPSLISLWQVSNALGCSLDKLTGRYHPSDETFRQIAKGTSEIYRILENIDTLSRNAL